MCVIDVHVDEVPLVLRLDCDDLCRHSTCTCQYEGTICNVLYMYMYM